MRGYEPACWVFRPALRISSVIFFVLLAAALILNICSFRVIVTYPFSLDESEEAGLGRKLSLIGPKAFLPVEGGGETISHALGYTFTHALIQKLFGPGQVPLRMYGIFHYYLCFILVLLLCRELCRGQEVLLPSTFFCAAVLFFINPLLVQHSVVINADNNILTTAILIFLLLFIQYERFVPGTKGYMRSRIILAAVYAGCFWAKEVTPFLVMGGVLFFRICNNQRKKLLNDLLFVAILGISIFWATWWGYCVMTGTDVFSFIKFTVIGKSKMAFSYRYISGIVSGIPLLFRWPAFWVSIPFMGAVCLIFMQKVINYFKVKKLSLADMLLIVAGMIWVPYQFFKPNPDMMKYQYPSYPIFIVAIAFSCAEIVFSLRHGSSSPPINTAESRIEKQIDPEFHALPGKKDIFPWMVMGWVGGFLVLLILCAHYYFLGDYLRVLWEPVNKHLEGLFPLYYYLPQIALLSVVAMMPLRINLYQKILISLVFLAVAINAGLLINQMNAEYATVEIYRNYGEQGMRNTIEFLSGKLSPNSVVAVRKDIFYNLKYVKNIPVKNNFDPKQLFAYPVEEIPLLLLARNGIEYVVIDKISMLKFTNEHMRKVIRVLRKARFNLIGNFGDFYVFEKVK